MMSDANPTPLDELEGIEMAEAAAASSDGGPHGGGAGRKAKNFWPSFWSAILSFASDRECSSVFR